MQQLSKTQQVINRHSYRKHKQKLQQIKQNSFSSTSQQFYSSSKPRPTDHKKLYLIKTKRQQIQQANQILKKKIQNINNTSTHQSWRKKAYSQSEQRKANKSMANERQQQNERYGKEKEDDKIQITSDSGNNEGVKCFVPSNHKFKVKYASKKQGSSADYNSIIQNLRFKNLLNEKNLNHDIKKQDGNQNIQLNDCKQDGIQNNSLKIAGVQNTKSIPSIANNDHILRLKKIIKQSNGTEVQDILYNEPEKQSHRIILYKKTKLVEPMISFLVQISLIQSRILIIAYGMGLATQNHKLLINVKKSKQILQQIKEDYQVLWERVSIQNGRGIKLRQDNNNLPQNKIGNENQVSQFEKQKLRQQNKKQITNDFLQRNYYTLLEGKKQQQKSVQIKKEKRETNRYYDANGAKQNSQQKFVIKSYMRPTISSQQQKQNYNNEQTFAEKIKIVGVMRKSQKKIEKLVANNNLKLDQTQKIKLTKLQPLKKQKNKQVKTKNTKQINSKNQNQNQNKQKFTNEVQNNQKINQKPTKIESDKQKQGEQLHDEQQYGQDQFQQSQQKYQDDIDIYDDDEQEIQQKNDGVKQKVEASNKQNNLQLKNTKSQVDEYAQSFEESNQIMAEQYVDQFQSNPSKAIKNNSSIAVAKKQTIANKSGAISSKSKQIEDQFEKSRSKKINESVVDEYLDQEFQV